MTPIDIGPHPQAPDHYIVMRRPPSMTDEQCGDLAIRRVLATGDMACEPAARLVRQDYEDAPPMYPCFMSEWMPTPEELGRLNAGLPIRTLVVGNGLPPMSIWVRGTDEV